MKKSLRNLEERTGALYCLDTLFNILEFMINILTLQLCDYNGDVGFTNTKLID